MSWLNFELIATELTMPYNPTRALELLRLGTQYPAAAFHDGQEEAIQHVVDGRGRLLVVQKTGWGKSSVYFIATKLLREAGMGPAILISPLLALMRNQIAAAARMGVRAVTIHSGNRDDWPTIEGAIARNEVDILLIHPKRLVNEQFNTQVLARIAASIPFARGSFGLIPYPPGRAHSSSFSALARLFAPRRGSGRRHSLLDQGKPRRRLGVRSEACGRWRGGS